MANTTLTVDVILKEAHRQFKNNTAFLQNCDRQYDKSYAAHGAKEGDTIRIKQPQRYTYRTGKTIQVQPNTENSVDLARTSQGGVDMKFSSKEKTLDISRFSELYLAPAMATITSNMENTVLTTAYQNISNTVTLPTTKLDEDDILDAGVLLDNGSCPRDGNSRTCIVTPRGQANLASSTATLFNPSASIGKRYLSGQMGPAYGFDFGMCQNIPSMTTGTRNSSYVMNGVGVEGASTLNVDTGSGTYVVGDAFTIANVNSINRLTNASTGRPQVFRVTTASAGGTATLAISPSLTTEGAYATIDALPANGAALTQIGTAGSAVAYPQNLAFHRLAFALGTADLEIPSGTNVGLTGRSVEDGISIRLVEFYDGHNDDTYYRLDILYGFVVVVPEWAVRIYGV